VAASRRQRRDGPRASGEWQSKLLSGDIDVREAFSAAAVAMRIKHFCATTKYRTGAPRSSPAAPRRYTCACAYLRHFCTTTAARRRMPYRTGAVAFGTIGKTIAPSTSIHRQRAKGGIS